MQASPIRPNAGHPGTDPAGIEAARDLECLVQEMLRGEVTALSRLYALTVRRVFAVAHRTLRSKEDAEEIVLDVYLYAWRNAGVYDSQRGSVLAWLSIMAKHRAIDRLRRRRSVCSFDDQQQETFAKAVLPTALGPEQILTRLQSNAAVGEALEALSVERRDLVRMAFVEGLTHEEIAAAVGRPLGTVKSHVRRGLAAMQQRLLAHR